MSNSFGTIYTLTSFGESHGKAIGRVIDGFPAGIKVDYEFLQQELNRRKPGQSDLTTSRKENDQLEILSGIFNGITTGAPIGFLVWNKNQHSDDYDNMRLLFRPSHADYTYYKKYGVRDYRGGGRSSARITISRVVAGAFAKIALRQKGISIKAYTSQVGNIVLDKDYKKYDLNLIDSNAIRCPDKAKALQMEELIRQVKKEGDTIGGAITCVIQGCPIGLGEPEFDKLHANLGKAMLSINAAKGFEYGEGFEGASLRGSEQNDVFLPILERDTCNNHPLCATNHSGGIQGGISNGEDIWFRTAFKPVATILQTQSTIDIKGEKTFFKAQGRHDPCVLPRAVPIVEAMAAMVVLDQYLLKNANRW